MVYEKVYAVSLRRFLFIFSVACDLTMVLIIAIFLNGHAIIQYILSATNITPSSNDVTEGSDFGLFPAEQHQVRLLRELKHFGNHCPDSLQRYR